MDIPCVGSKTFLVFEARHSVCSKQDISCVRSRTSRVFQAGHLLCSKQDISCVPSKTSLVSQARHLVCSKQDISCVPSKTFPVFQAGQSVCSKRKRLKNREDSSDLDDFLTESIASTQTFVSKNSRGRKKIRDDQKKITAHERSNERGGGNFVVEAVI